MTGWIRRPGEGRYAHFERERRFLLTHLPDGATDPRLVKDRYLYGTRLRLRKVSAGASVTYKLTQKVRPDPGDPGTLRTTNIYLDRFEYEVLAGLPADELAKTRSDLVHDGRLFAIDEFHGELSGLLLAETEVAGVRDQVEVPSFALREVTSDSRYFGGALALAHALEVEELIEPIPAVSPRGVPPGLETRPPLL